MKHIYVCCVIPFLYLGLFSMDDENAHDTHDANDNCTIYKFPALIEKRIYPIHIYQQYSHTEYKPFCASTRQYKRFLKYKEAEETLDMDYKENYKEMDMEKRKEFEKEIRATKKNLKESFAGVLFGKFCMHTAVYQKFRFKNPWYCLWSLKQQEILEGNLSQITPQQQEETRYGLCTVPYGYSVIPSAEKTICENTLKQFIQFLSSGNAEMRIGPFFTYTYSVLLQKNKEWELEDTNITVTILTPRDFKLKQLERLYHFWPAHDTKRVLKKIIKAHKIPLIMFDYQASPSSSPESESANFYHIMVHTVEQGSKGIESRSRNFKLS